MTIGDQLFIGVLLVTITYYITIKLIKIFNMRTKSKALKGKNRQAVNILQEFGYDIEDIKMTAPLNFTIDGKKYCKDLKIDGLVKKGLNRYIFMVKSNNATRLTSVPNRRLLLELFTVFGTKGIIWVDTETSKLKEVIFTPHIPVGRRINHFFKILFLIFIGFILSYLLLKGELN